MTHSEEEFSALALLSQLSVSPFPQPQSTLIALKRLKHELIGHNQKKELFVRLGIVAPLVRILEGAGDADEIWESARLEAGIAVGSLAYGGGAYISHLFESRALPSLIAALDPSSSPPGLLLSSLRTLNTMLDTSTSSETCPSYTISAALYTPSALASLCSILSQTSPSDLVQHQISLAASLVAKSCGRCAPGNGGSHSAHQKLLVEFGVLGALCARLGGCIVAEKSIPRHSKSDQGSDVPPPAPPGAKLAPILDAISIIIKDSELHSLEFLFATPLVAIFPPPVTVASSSPEVRPSSSNKAGEGPTGPTSSINLPQAKSATNSMIQPPNLLITPASFPPLSASSTISSHFPPLSGPTSIHPSSGNLRSFYDNLYNHDSGGWGGAQTMLAFENDSESSAGGDTPLRQRTETAESEDRIPHPAISGNIDAGSSDIGANVEIEESPILPWLISQVRSGDPITRSMAASVLTNLFKVKLVSKKLGQLLRLLVVPVLVRILGEEERDYKLSADIGSVESETWANWAIQEKTPTVLARLLMDNLELQEAAVEAGAIKKLANMLKEADELPALTSGSQDDYESASIERYKRFCLEVSHKMKVKEGTMKCLASLALFKDDYRKAIIEAGVVPILLSSMKPFDPPIPTPESTQVTPVQDHPPPVLTAACGAIRALSRSVAILRTSLIDAGVASPLIALLNHRNVEVRIASTAAVCNLVLDFSPMRREILDAGILDVLCSHAKSESAALRLNALWALKHLVLEDESEVKRKCFEGLGVEWLVEVIGRDFHAEVEAEDDEMAESEERHEDGGEGVMEDSIGNLRRLEVGRTGDEEYFDAPEERTRSWARKLPPKASAVMTELEKRERDEGLRERRENIALQEQGLDFVRNWISGKDRNQMIDFFFQSVGKDRVFDILEGRLEHRTYKKGGEYMIEYPPGEIVNSAVFVIVHLAAGSLSHKKEIIKRVKLLKLLSGLWNHRLTNVRSGLTWVLINLTWRDDQDDIREIRSIAKELIRLGFEKNLDEMSRDSELDIRERVKTVRHQFSVVESAE